MYFHQTTASEHDWNANVREKLRQHPEIKAIQQHHHFAYGETDTHHPLPFVYSISNVLAYGDMGVEVKSATGKTILHTPNITMQEIDVFWRVFTSTVRDTGFSGRIVMDTWIDGKKVRRSSPKENRTQRIGR